METQKELGKCPLLEKCRAISSINCKERDYTTCDFYLNCLMFKRKKTEKEKRLLKEFKRKERSDHFWDNQEKKENRKKWIKNLARKN